MPDIPLPTHCGYPRQMMQCSNGEDGNQFRAGLIDGAVTLGAGLLTAIPLSLFLVAIPSRWLAVFDALGNAMRPWLMGATSVLLVVSLYLASLRVLRLIFGIKLKPTT